MINDFRDIKVLIIGETNNVRNTKKGMTAILNKVNFTE